MKTCSLVALAERECHMWVKALRYLAEDTRKASYPLQLERWLRKEFYSMENPHSTVSVKDLKSWLQKVPIITYVPILYGGHKGSTVTAGYGIS